MKRRIIALCLLALLLTGCGAGGEIRHAAAATPAPTPFRPAATPRPTPVPAEQRQETKASDYAEVLVDTELCALEVTGIGLDRDGNWIVHLRMENRAEEIMNFGFLYQSINGIALAEELYFRVAVGGAREESFRILREELALWGFDRPVQWSFTLQVSSAETLRAPIYREELLAAPFGAENAVRINYAPAAEDTVAMDNEYAAVYLTGMRMEDGTLYLDYVAVSRANRPLLLSLPAGKLKLDGRSFTAELKDGFGAYSTLMGTIPVDGWSEKTLPESLQMTVALLDPFEKGEPVLRGSETEVKAELDFS